MKKIILGLLLLTGFAARADGLYQVEIIVFARASAEAENEENWSRHPALRYPAQTTVLQASDGGGGATYQLLPAEMLQLKREADAISQRRAMRVLTHAAWLQPLESPAQAKNIFISGGKQYGAHRELEGTLTLGVEHFVRVDANLWLSRFVSGGGGETLPPTPGIDTDIGASEFTATQTVVLQEQRRMRSGELHYFDHPKMGLVILVTRKTEAPAQ